MNTKIWKVEQLTAYPQVAGETNVVFSVAWRLLGTDGTYTATCYGTVSITHTSDVPYTAYENLTETQVINWVHSALGAEQVTAYEASIDVQISEQANPSTVNPPLPW